MPQSSYVIGEPSVTLQGLRLDGSRQDLLAADPMTSSVEGIARRWGFTHLSRYASSYRAAFGEVPSNALRDLNRSSSPRRRG